MATPQDRSKEPINKPSMATQSNQASDEVNMQDNSPPSPAPITRQSYQHMISAIPHPILITTLQGVIEYANSAAAQLLGFEKNELNAMPMGKLIPECADTFRVFRSKHFSQDTEPLCLGKTERDDLTLSEKEGLKITRKDKSSRYVELSLSSFETVDSRYVIVSIVDVDNHRRILDELYRSNQELDQFAYIASHDLKAPLRGLDNLVTWVYEDIDDKELVLEHVQMMRIRLHRMQTLLGDLLEYSRAGKVEQNLSQVDINYMAQDLYLQSSPPETFKLELGEPIQPIETLATPLAQALRNLINNAIKHNQQDKGIVKVTAQEQGDFITITVEDNGPGIEAQFQEQIFEMFEKLQSNDEVEGSGMGLALVKKITTAVGGSVSVSSAPNQYTRFCIQWPKHLSGQPH